MSSGLAVAGLPRAPVIDLFPTLEPYLVEVAIPFFSGTVDEAVRQASAIAENMAEAVYQRIVGNAPTVLDMFEEIDNAIGNDPNFATTMLTALATKALKGTKVTTSGLATGGGDLSADRTIAVPKATQDQATAGIDDTTAITPALLSAVIAYVFSHPGMLAGLLPVSPPPQSGVPWLNGGMVSIS